ncbi:uncharacterized protein FMRFa [Diabrotica undecimpunctata]|uniref:uncharacterized protein FMRFa n=1 Tax=Diabrotica undecimpunctata TaxID=50387 RepID=UPI003B637629
MISHSIFVFILVQSSLANLEDSYSDTPENFNVYSEEFLDPDESDIEKRDNHFMRFGRNLGDLKNREFWYDDYDDIDVPNKRSGNQHIRFGRSGASSFMRLGRDHLKGGRNKAHFMRIGRSFHEQDEKTRSKRSVDSSSQTGQEKHPKRKDIFLRFGKSPSFMRYGRRDDSLPDSSANFDYQAEENHPLALLLAKLLARREGSKPCDVDA